MTPLSRLREAFEELNRGRKDWRIPTPLFEAIQAVLSSPDAGVKIPYPFIVGTRWETEVIRGATVEMSGLQPNQSVGWGDSKTCHLRFTLLPPASAVPPPPSGVAGVWTAGEWVADKTISITSEWRVGNADENGGMMWSMFYSRFEILDHFNGYTHLYGPYDPQEGPNRVPPTTAKED